jgi:hypothetical protein
VSKEGDAFTVNIEVARMSELVKGMLEGELRQTLGVYYVA